MRLSAAMAVKVSSRLRTEPPKASKADTAPSPPRAVQARKNAFARPLSSGRTWSSPPVSRGNSLRAVWQKLWMVEMWTFAVSAVRLVPWSRS